MWIVIKFSASNRIVIIMFSVVWLRLWNSASIICLLLIRHQLLWYSIRMVWCMWLLRLKLFWRRVVYVNVLLVMLFLTIALCIVRVCMMQMSVTIFDCCLILLLLWAHSIVISNTILLHFASHLLLLLILSLSMYLDVKQYLLIELVIYHLLCCHSLCYVFL